MGETIYSILKRIADVLDFFDHRDRIVVRRMADDLERNEINTEFELSQRLSPGNWKFVKYKIPEKVNWLGWIEVGGEAIAWIDLDSKIFFKDDMIEPAPDPMEA